MGLSMVATCMRDIEIKQSIKNIPLDKIDDVAWSDDTSFEDAPVYYVTHDKITESFTREELSVEDLNLLQALVKPE